MTRPWTPEERYAVETELSVLVTRFRFLADLDHRDLTEHQQTLVSALEAMRETPERQEAA